MKITLLTKGIILCLISAVLFSCGDSKKDVPGSDFASYVFDREELTSEQFYDKEGSISADENPYDPPTIPPEPSGGQGGIYFEDVGGGANNDGNSNDIDKIILTGKSKATFYYSQVLIGKRSFSVKSKGDSIIFEPAGNFYTSYIKWRSPLISWNGTTPPIPDLTPPYADIINDPLEIKFLSTKRSVKTANGLILIDYLVTAYSKMDENQMEFNTLDIDYYKSRLLPGQVFKYVQRKRYFVGE